MQGGCLCENPPGLRLDTTNVEIAAAIAPRPLLMIAATGDWTKNTIEREYPAVRSIYSLLDAPDRVQAVRIDADHNYNRESREAMYGWMARWLQKAPADTKRTERSFTADAPADLMVFHQRPLPGNALSPAELTYNWIDAARRQLASLSTEDAARALRHVLGYGDSAPAAPAPPARNGRRVVLIAGVDADTEQQLRRARFDVRSIAAAAFDAEAAGKVRHFDTYNRTAAAQRAAEIVEAIRANPGAAVVAAGDSALAALLASVAAPPRALVLDVGGFDTSKDDDYVSRLYIPGLRRAGDLQTAARAFTGSLVLHNAGTTFALPGVKTSAAKLTAKDVVAALR